MGEAKLRKAVDPTYGRPKRGLVVSPPIEIDGERLTARSSNLDPQELRFGLLLWDKLVWPSSRAIHFASSANEEFLEKQGILSRPDFTFGSDVQGILAGYLKAFEDFEAREPGLWSLSEGENSLFVRGFKLSKSNTAQIELNRAIPIPDKDVPLEEILNFKRRRDAELVRLRAEIDRMIASVNAANDSATELVMHVDNIDSACADLLRVSHEWQFPVRLINLKTTYNVIPGEILTGALAGYIGQNMLMGGSSGVLGAALGAAYTSRSFLKMSFDGFEWRGLRARSGPYIYVRHFHDELF